jgi:hypothetical protein
MALISKEVDDINRILPEDILSGGPRRHHFDFGKSSAVLEFDVYPEKGVLSPSELHLRIT